MKNGRRNLFALIFVIVFTMLAMNLPGEYVKPLIAAVILFSGAAITTIMLSANNFK